MDWLLPIALSLISAGIIVSVLEEWQKWGLTDTSFTSLWCWVLGLCGVAVWGIVGRDLWVFGLTALPAGLFLYWIALKAKDRRKRRR